MSKDSSMRKFKRITLSIYNVITVAAVAFYMYILTDVKRCVSDGEWFCNFAEGVALYIIILPLLLLSSILTVITIFFTKKLGIIANRYDKTWFWISWALIVMVIVVYLFPRILLS